MTGPAEPTFAWEPLTPPGIVAFTRATLSRLLLVQFIVALLVGAAFYYLFSDSYSPIIDAAIQKLPDSGEIRSCTLDWKGGPPQMLAERRLLAFDVDPGHSGQIQSTADIQIEFGTHSIRVFSLFGYVDFCYQPDYIMPFNRTDLVPLWGAWKAEIVFLAAAAVALALMIIWTLLATLYFFPVWILGFFANRDLNLPASWKLSGAALMPGALLMAAGVVLYDVGFLSLVAFGFVFVTHFVLCWIYISVCMAFLPRIPGPVQRKNPFRKAKA